MKKLYYYFLGAVKAVKITKGLHNYCKKNKLSTEVFKSMCGNAIAKIYEKIGDNPKDVLMINVDKLIYRIKDDYEVVTGVKIRNLWDLVELMVNDYEKVTGVKVLKPGMKHIQICYDRAY